MSDDSDGNNNSNDCAAMRRELIQIKQNNDDRAELYAHVEHAIGITVLQAGNAIKNDDQFKLAQCQEFIGMILTIHIDPHHR